MITIGKKIKQLRLEKELSQANLYEKNPSHISLIENGKMKNPAEFVVREIAKNLEISFTDLVDGTDWMHQQNISVSSDGYAFSTYDYNLEVDKKTGKIIIALKYYPLFNKNGEKNIFCPTSGEKLITACTNCDRRLDKYDLSFCMGCGKSIQILDSKIYHELDSLTIDWDVDTLNRNPLLLKKELQYRMKNRYNNTKNDHQSSTEIAQMDDLAVLNYFTCFEEIRNDVLDYEKNHHTFTIKEWNKGENSSNSFIANHWRDYYRLKDLSIKLIQLLDMKIYDQQLCIQNETIEQYHMRKIRSLEREIEYGGQLAKDQNGRYIDLGGDKFYTNRDWLIETAPPGMEIETIEELHDQVQEHLKALEKLGITNQIENNDNNEEKKEEK
tara:strand:- start:411 stop:1562 length:1152 start_codon:yes stop_codon:yes gene_type:complete